MTLFGKNPSPPSPHQRPSFSPSERLGMAKPAAPQAPKQEVKPQPSKPLGFLGKEGYAREWQLREFARKAPYEFLPGTVQRLGKEQRGTLMKELTDRAKRIGQREGRQTYGISRDTFKAVIRSIEDPSYPGGSELYKLHSAGKYNEERELRRKVQLFKKWAGV